VLLPPPPTESLVVKLLGTNAGFTASGTPLDINDRIGGTVQLVGQPNHPVILTSIFDATVGAGFTPGGLVQSDTHNLKSTSAPTLPSTSGPVFLDGGDRDDHGFRNNSGNQNGWKFIQQALNFANTNSLNTAGAGILAIGVQENTDTPTQAELAIKATAAALGLNLTIVRGSDISTVNFSQFKLIYVPSDAGDTFGGISNADIALLAARKLDIQNYVNVVGGGLVALTEDFAAAPLSWLELPQAFSIAHTGGVNLTQTPLLAAAGFNITDQELSLGTPWHNSFVGPSGFNRLQPWVVDPDTGAIVTLGLGPGQGGIGPRNSDATAGDWRSVKLDTFSNDTNVDLLNEIEQGFAPTGDTNSLPTTAQFLGTLAKDNKSGDDNQRLGFEVHGSISQTVSSPNFGDVDVYSFKATAGTTVWFDIDRTSSSLDSVVELIDANGSVIARSDNSLNESQNPALLVGLAKPLQVGLSGSSSPFSNPDFYSTNPLDAGMRVDLPGTAGSVNTYFVRVRASSQDLTRLNGGLTKGSYQMQIRLQETDVFPGSVVRNADIRYAATGVDVIGKPEHSPLLGDTGETTNVHNSLQTAQDLGNLLTSDTNSVSVAGNLAAGDVDWYKLNLNYDLVTSFGALPGTARFFPALFQINYADGLARPDTTLSIFDKNGNLIYIGRDSDNPDSQPRSSLGTDTANTSHGSFGTLDPTIGTVELPAGSPSDIGSTTGAGFTYYVAVSASNKLPTVLNATFKLNATNPTVRLQPLNSVTRVFDDSIGAGGTQQAFPGTTGPQLDTASTPYSLADVVAFVTDGFELLTINPFTGQLETVVAGLTRPNIALPGAGGVVADRVYDDMAMRTDGRLMAFPVSANGSATVNGTYVQINPGDGTALTPTQGGIAGQFTFDTSDVDPNQPVNQGTLSTPATFNFTNSPNAFGIAVQGMSFTNNEGFFFNGSSGGVVNGGGRTLYIVGNRAAGNGTIPETQNLLFRLNPDTGAAFSFDLESNRTFHSGQPIFQPFPDPLNHPEGPGSGTAVVPRGALATGSVMIAQAATDPVSARNATGALNDIVDGATFLITVPNGTTTATTRKFQFESGPQLNLDNPSIPGSNGVAALRSGQEFLINGVGSGGTQPINFQLVSGPVLNAVGSGAGLLGQTFSIEDKLFQNLTFEFGTAGSVGAGHVPVAIGSSAAATAANIVTAINVTAKSINPNYVVQAALPSVGSTRVTLINDLQDDAAVNTSGAAGISKQGNWDQVPGNAPIFFEETDSVTTFGNEMADGVKAAFSATSVSVNASFARDRITFLGAASADFSSFTAASSEFSVQGAGGVTGGSTAIRFNAADTQDQIAAAIAGAINSASIPGRTIVSYPTAAAITASVSNGRVNISDGQFASDFANPIDLALKTDGAGRITGLAFLPNSANTQFNGGDDLYAVSDTGAIYKVNDYSTDNGATLELLNVFKDEFGQGVQFSGLSAGPPRVENGRYERTLFATDRRGNIWAFDDQGNPASIFVNGASHVNVDSAFSTSTSFGSFFLQGIAFSTLDYNLWHATTTHGSDPTTLPLPNMDDGNKSFYFGLENADFSNHPVTGGPELGFGGNSNVLPSEFWQPGATDYSGALISTRTGSFLNSVNAALVSSYNLPGGALGSLSTAEFDLSNYTAGDKPTLYFDYAADTQDTNASGSFMRDSFRVYATSDGAHWEQLATNNSVLGSELPPIPSVNGGQYEGDRTNQQVQELFDPTGRPSLISTQIPGSPTLVQNWRQARVDLGDFAGKSGVQIRFDFSTAGSLGIGAIMQGGVYMAGVEGAKLQEGQQFVIDNSVVTGFSLTTGPQTTVTNHTFTFRSGYILQAPAGGGKAITSGETFTVNGKTYEFSKTSSLPIGDSNVLVSISDNLTPEGVASAILAAMTVNPVAGVTPVGVADRVQLQTATSISQSPGHALIVQGAALPATLARTDVPYLINMSAADVAMEVAKALDREFTFANGNVDDPSVLTTAKVSGRTIRLYGHNVINAGPLPYSNSLQGDDQGRFYSPEVYDIPAQQFVIQHTEAAQRGENNAHQGVFIDNVIVGFAGRGEQVLNAQLPPPTIDPNNPPDPNAPPPVLVVSTFDTLPVDTSGGTRITTGPYQLSVRRGSEYIPGALIPGSTTQFSPGQTIDINDRLASGITIYAIPASSLIDGQTFSIAVESGVFTFEFIGLQRSPAPGNIPVIIHAGDDALAVALSIRNAINNVASSTFGVKAGLNNNSMVSGQTLVAINLFGASDVLSGPLTKRVFGPNLLFSNLVLPVVGDASPVRIQGQTIIQGTQISNTLQTGISVRPEFGETSETGLPTVGSPGHTGSVANLATLNNAQLVPGVTIKDNLIFQGGLTGILFSGSPTTDIAHEVPFGRIVNNTIVATPAGIKVTDNASPTILNNIIAQTKAGITIDNTSTTSVIGANLYQSNTKNLVGATETNAIVLQPTDPLFVDTTKRNFYLKQNSLAIDSSLNSLQERAAMQAVTAPLGIAPSQIQAPDFDLLGQLRIDDPTVASPAGLGSNVFKDRGAIERADVLGPSAALRNPVDNDAAALDRNVAVNKVTLVGRQLSEFTIQLNDAGIGVDTSTVDATKFVVQRTVGTTTEVLKPSDFTVGFDDTNMIVRLVPTQGSWSYGTYTITLDRSATKGIKDTAGNLLQPNDSTGATQFVIQETATAISPWQNQLNPFDVNGVGGVSGLDALLVINRLLLGQAGPLPAVATAPPYLDVNGDGSLSALDALAVINYLTTHPAGAPQAQPLVTTEIVSAAPAAAPLAAAPLATAATAPTAAPATQADAVVTGLAIAQMSAVGDEEADAVASGAAYAPTSGDSPSAAGARSASAAAVSAAFASDSLADNDSDFDDVLSDLAEDTCQLQASA
jgi:Dockerin type I domain/Right handed beta helix region/Bacterial pre-peptidase C-terminal domain